MSDTTEAGRRGKRQIGGHEEKEGGDGRTDEEEEEKSGRKLDAMRTETNV